MSDSAVGRKVAELERAEAGRRVTHVPKRTPVLLTIGFGRDAIPYKILEEVFLLARAKIDELLERKSGDEVQVLAKCECFQVCDAQGNCHQECYLCYPPPDAHCVGPYPYGCS